VIAAALIIGTPFFIVFGALSDRIGRKKIILAGCLIAAITYFPLFNALTHYANPALGDAVASAPVTVVADPQSCSFQFDPVGRKTFTSSCDIAKAALARSGVPYKNEAGQAGAPAFVRVGSGDAAQNVASFEGSALASADFKAATDRFVADLKSRLTAAGYPAKADPQRINYPMVIAICTLLVIYVTMVYGPIAAWLVELFPARIR
jgi:MFS family permease